MKSATETLNKSTYLTLITVTQRD